MSAVAHVKPGNGELVATRVEERSEGGRVAYVTVTNEAKYNALPAEGRRAIGEAMKTLSHDPELRVIVLTGAGDKAFIGGANVGEMSEFPNARVAEEGSAQTHYACDQIRRAPVPVIARINGYCLGAGMEIATSCDMRVASRNAKFGIPEVKRGLAAAAGGLIRMPRQMPFRVAMEYALTGEFFGAERAYELGIINRLTDGPALDAALELAKAIGANGPMAVKASKQVVVQSRLWTEDEMWKKQQEIVAPVFTSADAREGAAAFAEKRAPNWKGK